MKRCTHEKKAVELRAQMIGKRKMKIMVRVLGSVTEAIKNVFVLELQKQKRLLTITVVTVSTVKCWTVFRNL